MLHYFTKNKFKNHGGQVLTVIAAPDKAGVALGQCYVSSSPSLPAYLPLSARSLSLSLSLSLTFPSSLASILSLGAGGPTTL